MLAFLANLRDLCLFRRGPEDMPYAPALLVVLLVASAAAQASFDLYRGISPLVILAALAGTLATLGVLLWILRRRGKAERFVQTALAMVATSLLFELIVMPLIAVAMPAGAAAATASPPPKPTAGQALAALAVLFFAVWQVCISVNILRRALEIPIVGGVLVLLLLGCVNWIVIALLARLLGVA